MNKNILIIDNDKNILNDFSSILMKKKDKKAMNLIKDFIEIEEDQSEKYEIDFNLDFSSDPEIAIKKVQEKKNSFDQYSVIFIDINLIKKYDGLFYAKKINEIAPNSEIVLITAFSDISRKKFDESLVKSENFLYLRKPFSAEEIEQFALNLSYKFSISQSNIDFQKRLKELINIIRQIKGRVFSRFEDLIKFVLNHILHFTTSKSGLVINKTLKGASIVSLIEKRDYLVIEDVIRNINSNNYEDIFFTIDNFFVLKFLPSKGHNNEFYFLIEDENRNFQQNINFISLLHSSIQGIIDNFFLKQKFIEKEKLASVGLGANKIFKDLKIPLKIILDYIETIAKEIDNVEIPETEKQKILGYLNQIKNTKDGMIDTIESIVSFSEGEQHLHEQLVYTQKYLEDIYKEFKIILDENHIVSDLTIHDNCKLLVDKYKLKRCILNIVSNAIQAFNSVNQESKIFELRAGIKEGLFSMEFYGNGPEIPAETKKDMFDSFKTTGNHKGTGLGLCITKQIVEKHNGKIYFKSDKERTSFFIDLPFLEKLED